MPACDGWQDSLLNLPECGITGLVEWFASGLPEDFYDSFVSGILGIKPVQTGAQTVYFGQPQPRLVDGAAAQLAAQNWKTVYSQTWLGADAPILLVIAWFILLIGYTVGKGFGGILGVSEDMPASQEASLFKGFILSTLSWPIFITSLSLARSFMLLVVPSGANSQIDELFFAGTFSNIAAMNPLGITIVGLMIMFLILIYLLFSAINIVIFVYGLAMPIIFATRYSGIPVLSGVAKGALYRFPVLIIAPLPALFLLRALTFLDPDGITQLAFAKALPFITMVAILYLTWKMLKSGAPRLASAIGTTTGVAAGGVLLATTGSARSAVMAARGSTARGVASGFDRRRYSSQGTTGDGSAVPDSDDVMAKDNRAPTRGYH